MRERYRTTTRKTCAKQGCEKEFFTTDTRKRFCSDKCRLDEWHNSYYAKYPEKKIKRYNKKQKWKDWYASLTEEQKNKYLCRHMARRLEKREKETPEEGRLRREKWNAKMREYREKRKAQGRPIVNIYIKRKEWLAKKKEELKNKPWIYETILQKYQRPDGSISERALK